MVERLQLTEADRETITKDRRGVRNCEGKFGKPEILDRGSKIQAKFYSLNKWFTKLADEKTKLQETVPATEELKELSTNVKKSTEEKHRERRCHQSGVNKLRLDTEQLRQKNVDQERWFNNEINELRNWVRVRKRCNTRIDETENSRNSTTESTIKFESAAQRRSSTTS